MSQNVQSESSVYVVIKPLFDRFLAVLLLPIFVLLTPLICLVIVFTSPGSPLFFQRRVGANGREFTMIKFRTMRLDTPNVSTSQLQAMKIDPITGIGHFLRRSSLDELPQIINILLGDMSFVGPRPALPSQHDVLELSSD